MCYSSPIYPPSVGNSLTIPAFTCSQKVGHAALAILAVGLMIIGALALLAMNGVVVAGAFAQMGPLGGFLFFFGGLGIGFIQVAIFACKKEKHYNFDVTEEGLLHPVTKEYCCAPRFMHGEEDEVNPLWNTIANILLIPEGGFTKYFLSQEQKDLLYDSQPVTDLGDNKVRVRRLGHAGFLIETQVNGKVSCFVIDLNQADTIPFMTIPLINVEIPLYYRFLPPGLPLDKLPKLDAALYSHTHADHLNIKTLEDLRNQPNQQNKPENPLEPEPNEPLESPPPAKQPDPFKIYCPLRAGSLLSKFTNVHECDWWEQFTLPNGTKITFVPSDHASQTTATNCNEFLWGGYMISVPLDDGTDYNLFFMGDTACNINPGIQGFQPYLCQFDRQVFGGTFNGKEVKGISTEFPHIHTVLYPTDPIKGQEEWHSNIHQGCNLLDTNLKPEHMVIPHHNGTWPFNTWKEDQAGPQRSLKELVDTQYPGLKGKMCYLKTGQQQVLVNGRDEWV